MTANGISNSSQTSVAGLALLFGTMAMMAGCGGSDSTRPAPPPPPVVWNVVAGRAWTMPAETEGYVCVGVHMTSEGYFTGFRLVSPIPAQNEVLLTVTSASGTEGPFACGAGSLDNELIYAANRGTTPVEFPAGFGVHVSAGQ